MLPRRPIAVARSCARAASLARCRDSALLAWRLVRSAFAPGGLALCALLLLAPRAHAFQLTAIRPARDAGNQLWVELRLDEPIEPRVAKSLGRGMPATLTLHAELWRRRNGWFDRMERAVDASFRLRYDIWSDTWRLDRPGGGMLEVRTLDSLQIALERTLVMPVASLEQVPSQVPCYVVVSAALQPLSVKDFEETEVWMWGEVREKQGSPFGFLTGLPHSLFEAARNFAGFGDERSRLISADFTPANLPRLSR